MSDREELLTYMCRSYLKWELPFESCEAITLEAHMHQRSASVMMVCRLSWPFLRLLLANKVPDIRYADIVNGLMKSATGTI